MVGDCHCSLSTGYVSSVLGERKDESGEQQGARGKAWLLYVAAGARGGVLPRYQLWAAVAARPGAGGSEPREKEGWRRQAGPGRQRLGRSVGGGCGQAVRLGWAAQRAAVLRALGRAGQGGELGRGRTRLRVKVRRPAGRSSRREREK